MKKPSHIGYWFAGGVIVLWLWLKETGRLDTRVLVNPNPDPYATDQPARQIWLNRIYASGRFNDMDFSTFNNYDLQDFVQRNNL